MAAINFPNSPSTGDTFTVGSRVYYYDGSSWLLANTSISTSAAFDKANLANQLANGAFRQANVANTLSVGNTMSNGYFSVRTSQRTRLNFIPASANVRVNVDDDSAGDRINVTIEAISGGGGGAPGTGMNVTLGNTLANTYYLNRVGPYANLNLIDDALLKWNINDDSTNFRANVYAIVDRAPFNVANTANLYANLAFMAANGAFLQANAANVLANTVNNALRFPSIALQISTAGVASPTNPLAGDPFDLLSSAINWVNGNIYTPHDLSISIAAGTYIETALLPFFKTRTQSVSIDGSSKTTCILQFNHATHGFWIPYYSVQTYLHLSGMTIQATGANKWTKDGIFTECPRTDLFRVKFVDWKRGLNAPFSTFTATYDGEVQNNSKAPTQDITGYQVRGGFLSIAGTQSYSNIGANTVVPNGFGAVYALFDGATLQLGPTSVTTTNCDRLMVVQDSRVVRTNDFDGSSLAEGRARTVFNTDNIGIPGQAVIAWGDSTIALPNANLRFTTGSGTVNVQNCAIVSFAFYDNVNYSQPVNIETSNGLIKDITWQPQVSVLFPAINASFSVANTGNLYANLAFRAANAVYDFANTMNINVAATMVVANTANVRGNLAQMAANAAFAKANTALQNVVEDTTPQLGGTLDGNGFNIDFTDAHGITWNGGDTTLKVNGSGDGKDLKIDYGAVDTWPSFTLSSSTPGSDSVGFVMMKDSPSPATDDFIGYFEAWGRDVSGGDVAKYGGFAVQIVSAADGAHTGSLQLKTGDAGAWQTSLDIRGQNFLYNTGAVFNWNAGDVTLTHSSNALTLAGGDLFVPDEAYVDANWDGDLSVPTKNAIRDKIVLMDAIGAGAFAVANNANLYANLAFRAANAVYDFANTMNINVAATMLVANVANVRGNLAQMASNAAFAVANLALPAAGGTITGDLRVNGLIQGNLVANVINILSQGVGSNTGYLRVNTGNVHYYSTPSIETWTLWANSVLASPNAVIINVKATSFATEGHFFSVLDDGSRIFRVSKGSGGDTIAAVLGPQVASGPRFQIAIPGESFGRINFGINGSDGVPGLGFGDGTNARDIGLERLNAGNVRVTDYTNNHNYANLIASNITALNTVSAIDGRFSNTAYAGNFRATSNVFTKDLSLTGNVYAALNGGATAGRLNIVGSVNNMGIGIYDPDLRWTIASYAGAGLSARDFTFYNEQTGSDAMIIDGNTNNITFGGDLTTAANVYSGQLISGRAIISGLNLVPAIVGAFAQANASNLQITGNTMANGYYATRASRNRVNFIPGTNVQVNVDDDSSGDRVNVTISATGSGGISAVIQDTTPTLGGRLEINGQTISGNGKINIASFGNNLSTREALGTFFSANAESFPNGWGNTLKLRADRYPALWFSAGAFGGDETTGLIYAFEGSTANTFWMEHVKGDFSTENQLKWDFNNLRFFPEGSTWRLGSATKPWGGIYLGDTGIAFNNDTAIWRVNVGNVSIGDVAGNRANLFASNIYASNTVSGIEGTFSNRVIAGQLNVEPAIVASFAVANNANLYANLAFRAANAAYDFANAINIKVDTTGNALSNVANTYSNGYVVLQSSRGTLNFMADTVDIKIRIQDNSTHGLTNVRFDAPGIGLAYGVANAAKTEADAVFGVANVHNGAILAANTIAIAAFDVANAHNGAMAQMNSAIFAVANNANLYANLAFRAANAAYDFANAINIKVDTTGNALSNVANTYSNGYVVLQSSRGTLNFMADTTDIKIRIQDNATHGLTNVRFDAPGIGAAYTLANSANILANQLSAVAQTYSNGYVIQMSTRGTLNFMADTTDIKIAVQDNATHGLVNVRFDAPGIGAAYTQANAAKTEADAVFGVANVHNAAMAQMNTAIFGVANNANLYANLAFRAANAAYDFANAINIKVDTTGNALSNVANTYSNGYVVLQSSRGTLNFMADTTDIKIRIQDNATHGLTNVRFDAPGIGLAYAQSNIAMLTVSSAYDRDNVVSGVANNANVYANLAFRAANAVYDFANVININVAATMLMANFANILANSLSNVAQTYSNGYVVLQSSRGTLNFMADTTDIKIRIQDNATHGLVNVRFDAPGIGLAYAQSNIAMLTSSTAYDKANLANQLANGAFLQANVANLYPVGNTMSNSYFAIRSSSRTRINFIPSGSVTINVDDDSAGDRVNVTIGATGGPGGSDMNVTIGNTQGGVYTTRSAAYANINFINSDNDTLKFNVDSDLTSFRINVKTILAPVFVSDSPPVTPIANTLWFESNTGSLFLYYADSNSSQYIELGGFGPGLEREEVLTFAIADEFSQIVTGANRFTYHFLKNFTCLEVMGSLSQNSSSGNTFVDVNKNGTSIFTQNVNLYLANSHTVNFGAPVLSGSTITFTKGDKLNVNVGAAGTGATGLKLHFRGYWVA